MLTVNDDSDQQRTHDTELKLGHKVYRKILACLFTWCFSLLTADVNPRLFTLLAVRNVELFATTHISYTGSHFSGFLDRE